MPVWPVGDCSSPQLFQLGDASKASAPRQGPLERGLGALSPVYPRKSAGGVAWPNSFPPQQATEPLLLTPQAWAHPTLTETREPAGGVARPASLKPQQATEPLLLTPQVCRSPALTETKEPAGGVARPSPLLPQQATEPLLLTPQRCGRLHCCPSRRRSRRVTDGDEGTRGRRGLARD